MSRFIRTEKVRSIFGGFVHGDESLVYLPVRYAPGGTLVLSAIPFDQGGFMVPGLQELASSLQGGSDVANNNSPLPIGLTNADVTEDNNADMIASIASGSIAGLTQNIADVVSDRIAVHTVMAAVYKRNADGTVVIDPATKAPVYAKDANGHNMVGPLLFQWSPEAVQVKSVNVTDLVNQPSDYTAPDAERNGDKVKIGGFVAGGGGGSGNCSEFGCIAD